MLSKIFSISQLILSVLMIVAIMLQQKGVGLGSAFGGTSNIYTTKKGIDKVLFRFTIFVTVLFFIIAIANLIV